MSASESNVESSEEEGDKKPKAKKLSPVASKYCAYKCIIYHLFVFVNSIFLMLFFHFTC